MSGLMHYGDSDGKNRTPVTAATPLPATAIQRVRAGATYSELSKPSASFYLASSAANSNAQVIATGARDLHYVTGVNTVASVRYLKFYNKATSPNPASDTPVMTLSLPASSAFQFAVPGFTFSTGIGIVIVTGAAVTDATAGSAGDIVALNIAIGALS
jgi:hypothetical protein